MLNLRTLPQKIKNIHVEASLAFDIHEEGVGGLNKALELVLLLLELHRWVQQIDIILENLFGILQLIRLFIDPQTNNKTKEKKKTNHVCKERAKLKGRGGEGRKRRSGFHESGFYRN